MFALPRYVIKAGEVVVDDGELRAAPPGATLLVAPEVDPAARSELDAWFLSEASVHPSSFRVGEDEVSRPAGGGQRHHEPASIDAIDEVRSCSLTAWRSLTRSPKPFR